MLLQETCSRKNAPVKNSVVLLFGFFVKYGKIDGWEKTHVFFNKTKVKIHKFGQPFYCGHATIVLNGLI